MSAKILLVEDVRTARVAMETFLVSEGFAVAAFKSAEEVLKSGPVFDLALLDINLPGKNGFKLGVRLRQQYPEVPILMLSGRDTTADQLRAFSIPVDDYIVKGTPHELILARILRALERVKTSPLIPARQEAKLFLDGQEIKVEELTPTEEDLVKVFANEPERYFTSGELLDFLRGKGFVCEESMLYVHIYNLRGKLEKYSLKVENVRGRGYHVLSTQKTKS